jgi:hypothetical protein
MYIFTGLKKVASIFALSASILANIPLRGKKESRKWQENEE